MENAFKETDEAALRRIAGECVEMERKIIRLNTLIADWWMQYPSKEEAEQALADEGFKLCGAQKETNIEAYTRGRNDYLARLAPDGEIPNEEK